ncbi:MAG: GNAT family N-acetyltransferase [Algibacter sp.]|uniref:GNAT family N-acetyltransferase n=1 Tax=Algibacter sp. TaxID=1872428 RepID=UPI00262BD9C3|nr:GNAT family N-acetyltransferase [Algibacter sp.]MDG1728719.1 GNAT family N-acetyltransferase [Algibacter sp.]MDG2178778.1 GNAT family N-acetyltransferase [Algibacter sp.]
MNNLCSNLNLFEELFQNLRLPDCYLNLSYKGKKGFTNFNAPKKTNSLVYSNILAPNYLNYSIDKNRFKFIKIKQANEGFAIDMAGLSSAKAYIDSHSSRSFRKMVRQSIRRLEHSFNISYKMYYNDISKEEYDKLLETLRNMLDKRFRQKKRTHKVLGEWEQKKELFYNSLKKKNASIFVIYDSLEPIGISLNYLSGSIVFSNIASYNTDYHKFSLGHIDIYKNIDWCVENDYELMELAWGDLQYKRRWCNDIYTFEHHILYKKNSILGLIIGNFEYCKIYIKEFLKRKNFHLYLQRLKKKRTYNEGDREVKVSFEKYLETEENSTCKEINWKTDEFKCLRKIIYDFLYLYQENVNDIKVFSFDKQLKAFYIQGNKNKKKFFLN